MRSRGGRARRAYRARADRPGYRAARIEIPPDPGLDKSSNQVVAVNLCTCRSDQGPPFVNGIGSMWITPQAAHAKGKSFFHDAHRSSCIPGRPRIALAVKPFTHTFIHNANRRRALPWKMNDLQKDAQRCGENVEHNNFVARVHRRACERLTAR